jgi:hypothetical protein
MAKVRMESLDGELLHEGTDARVVKADRGAQLYFRLPDALAMDLAASRRQCVIVGQSRKFTATFCSLTNDGISILDLVAAQ